jgi:hypothetical protein
MARTAAFVIAASVLACACSHSNTPVATPVDAQAAEDAEEEEAREAGVTAEVYGHTDLPRKAATQGLSATAFDPSTRTLYALRDNVPSITPLQANDDYTVFTPGPPIALTGRPSAEWDGEGLVLSNGGFVAVTVETVPTVERFSLDGTYVEPVTFPAIYEKQRGGNKGLESLSLSPTGQYLFTCNEQALLVDGAGPTKQAGSVVRIARLSASTLQGTQHAYRTEPLGAGTGGDMGVSDLAALDDETLLVLERGYQSDIGNTVRLFRVSLSGAADVSALDALPADVAALPKQLVVDLATLPSSGFTHPSTQPNPILDNYESLSLGPSLPDGRKLLFVTSDDNAQSVQVARVLVLALRGI